MDGFSTLGSLSQALRISISIIDLAFRTMREPATD
jgi:hypothetical protein